MPAFDELCAELRKLGREWLEVPMLVIGHVVNNLERKKMHADFCLPALFVFIYDYFVFNRLELMVNLLLQLVWGNFTLFLLLYLSSKMFYSKEMLVFAERLSNQRRLLKAVPRQVIL